MADIVGGFEEGKSTAMTLCDLSSAFDCVDQGTLLCKMDKLGFRGLASGFFCTYISNRLHCVALSDNLSMIKEVT